MKTLPLTPVTVADPISTEAAIMHHVATAKQAARSGYEFDNLRRGEAEKAALLKLNLVLAELGFSEITGLSIENLYGDKLVSLRSRRGPGGLKFDALLVNHFSQEQIPDSVIESLQAAREHGLFDEFRVVVRAPLPFQGPARWEGLLSLATEQRYLVGVIKKIGRETAPIMSVFAPETSEEEGEVHYFGWSKYSDQFSLDTPRIFLIDQWQVAPH